MRALYEVRVHRGDQTLITSYVQGGWSDVDQGEDRISLPVGNWLVVLSMMPGPYRCAVDVNYQRAFYFTRAYTVGEHAPFERVSFLLDGEDWIVEYRVRSVHQ